MATLLKTSAIVVTLILPAALLPAAEDNIPDKNRQLGDTAFKSDMYSLALNYYKQYLTDSNRDSENTLDAYFCLISTSLQADNPAGAETFMSELKSKYSDYAQNDSDLRRKIQFWEAEILLGKNSFSDALKAFKKIVDTSESNDFIKLNSIAGLGISQVRLQQFTLAEQTFKLLSETASKDSRLHLYAEEQLLLIYLMNKNFKAVNDIIGTSLKNYSNETDSKLLKVYSLVAQNKLEEAVTAYNEIKARPYPLDTIWFITAYSIAKAYMQSGDYEKALHYLNQTTLLAKNIYDKELIAILRINAYIKLNSYSLAIETASQFLKDFPYSTAKGKILLTLSQSMAIEQKYDDIKKLASQYFNFNDPINSDNSQLAILIGRTFIRLKDYNAAVKYFDYIVRNSKDNQDIGEAKYWKSEILNLQGKYDEALKNLIVIQTDYPASREAAMLKEAQIYMSISNYSKASSTLQKLLETYPDSTLQPPPMYLYAASLRYLGDMDSALNVYMNFAEKYPGNENAPAAYFEAASISLSMNKIKQAISLFEEFIEKYRGSELAPNALYKLIYACYLDGDIPKVKQYAKEIIEKYPSTVFAKQTHFWMADYYTSIQQYKNAEEILSGLLSKYKDDPLVCAKAELTMAVVLNKENRNSQAVQILNDLQAKYPDDKIIPQCYFLEGDILSSMGKYSEAIDYYMKSEKYTDEPDISAASTGRIGDCYYAMFNYAQDRNSTINSALSYYEKLLDNKKLSELFRIQALYKTGKCYELKNNIDKAIEKYHEAFYTNQLILQNGRNPSSEWFIKSGISLVKLLQDKNTPESDKAAIEVLDILGRDNILSKDDIEKRINEIKSN